MKPSITYTFIYSDRCNMCGSASTHHKVLGKRLNSSQGKSPAKKNGITTTIMQCKDCGLIFPNPMPIPKNIMDHYGVPPEDYWNENYLNLELNSFNPIIKELQSYRNYCPGARALDVGMGLGFTVKALENAGYEAWGIEPSDFFYTAAIKKMHILPDRIKMCSLEESTFDNNYFDFITFGASLEHMTDPDAALRKAIQWLKPSGILQAEVPSSSWLISKLANLFYFFLQGDYVANLSPMHSPYHLFEFSVESFKKNGLLNNYTLISHDYFVCETYLPSAFNFLLRPLMKKTNSGMQLNVWLRKHEPESIV